MNEDRILGISSRLWSQGDIVHFVLLGDIETDHPTFQTDDLKLEVTVEVRSGGGLLPGSLPCLEVILRVLTIVRHKLLRCLLG